MQLELAIVSWLAPEVPDDWLPPGDLLDAMVLDRHVEPVAVDSDALGLGRSRPGIGCPTGSTSPLCGRMPLLNGGRPSSMRIRPRYDRLVWACSAESPVSFSPAWRSSTVYIRADEATRGYYTIRLRLVAAAAVGAAGVVIYRMLA